MVPDFVWSFILAVIPLGIVMILVYWIFSLINRGPTSYDNLWRKR